MAAERKEWQTLTLLKKVALGYATIGCCLSAAPMKVFLIRRYLDVALRGFVDVLACRNIAVLHARMVGLRQLILPFFFRRELKPGGTSYFLMFANFQALFSDIQSNTNNLFQI